MKTALGITPIVISFVLLAAHFLRASQFVLVALCVLFAVLLLVPRRWAARSIQAALVAGTFEWMLSLVLIVQQRMSSGLPYTRVSLILAAVAALTLASAFAFLLPALRKRYRLDAQAVKGEEGEG